MNFLFPYLARWKTINWTRYHQLFTRLAEKGHKVYVLQPPRNNMTETNFQEIQVEVPKNLELIEVPLNEKLWNTKLPLNKLMKKGYYAVNCSKKIKQLVKEKKIDAIMLYNIPQYFMMGHDCITLFDYADDYMDMLKKELGPAGNPIVMNLAKKMLRNMVQRSDIVLAVSYVLANSIKHWNPDVAVVPNGAARNDFENYPKMPVQKPNNGPVIGFIGSFEYFIDFDLIISVAEKMPNHNFLLVGGGRLLDYVKQKQAEKNLKNIILTGSVPHSKIAGYIEHMDICLNIFKKIPVSHGACPLKLFEYLIMKKPVITTRLEEIEIIDKKYCFYGDTPDEVVKQINHIMSNPAEAKEYAQRGYDITLKDYDWNHIVDQMLELIEKKKKSPRARR